MCQLYPTYKFIINEQLFYYFEHELVKKKVTDSYTFVSTLNN